MKFDRLRRPLKDDFERALAGLAVERGWITPAQLDEAMLERAHPKRLGEILTAKGWLSADQLAELSRAVVLQDLATAAPVPPEAQGAAEVLGECLVVQKPKAWDRRLGRWVRVEPGVRVPAHPNLLPTLRTFDWEGRSYCVSPWVDAASLADAAPRRQIEAVRDAALALQAAHERGITHGRIDATRILIGESAWLFGFSADGTIEQDVRALQALAPPGLPPCSTAFELAQQLHRLLKAQ